MTQRELIVRVDSAAEVGRATFLAYSIDGAIEFVVSEGRGADAAMTVTAQQALDIAESLRTAAARHDGSNSSKQATASDERSD